MSPMKLVLALATALLVMGCGPSTAQIKNAKAAQYNAKPQHLLDLALQVTQFDYKVGAIDIEGLKFQTAPQWYSSEGGRISPFTDGNGNFVNAGGGDVQVSFVVRVRLVENDRSMIEITPVTKQLVGTPNDPTPMARDLKPDDPYLPPWILGRVDALALAIYDQAKKRYLPPGG